MIPDAMRPASGRSLAAPLLLVTGALVAGVAPAASPPAFAQFEAAPGEITEDAILTGYPTIEGIRKAHQAGHTTERILAWIHEQNALFTLDLDETMQLSAEGLDLPIISAMAQMPEEVVGPLLESLGKVYVARTAPREGLSKRRLLKMMEYGAPESEILATIAEKGSRAELTLAEAGDLMKKGASPRLVVAIGRGIVPPETAAAAAPLLDEVGEEEEEVEADQGEELEAGELPGTLEEIYEEEGVPQEIEGGPKLVVMSDPPGARISMAPATIRPADLLELPRSAGRTPVDVAAGPGSWYVLVEKTLDAFDADIIPALRTVHDGEGSTRTLVQDGIIYYDVQRCCRPRALTGEMKVTRIAEDQPGRLLGDEFDGMPPYLWDGNRYLILQVERGRIRKLIKVYLIRRAAAEERTLMATFIPSSAEPLDRPAALEAVSTRARTEWEVPSPEEFAALAKMSGVPESEVPRIHARLVDAGKAVWKREDDASVRILTFGLESMGRLRIDDVALERTDLFGMLETPRPAKTGPTAAAAKAPGPLPPFRRIRQPETDLPVLEITNSRKVAAVVRLGDGTTFYVPPGGSISSEVSPGTQMVEARFDDASVPKLQGRALFSYHALYRLSLD